MTVDDDTSNPVVQLRLPCPLSLVMQLLTVVGDWHNRECHIDGCRVYLADGGKLIHDTATPQR